MSLKKLSMHRVQVTAVKRQDFEHYYIPGNATEVSPDPQRPDDKYYVLGFGLDENGQPRATRLLGGEPTEIEADDMLLAHLQKDELVTVKVLDDEPPAAKAATPSAPPSQKGQR